MEEKVIFAPKTVKIKGGEILIRLLREEDGPQLALEEQAQGWGTTTEKFEMRMRDFAAGACIPLCAELDGQARRVALQATPNARGRLCARLHPAA